MTSQDLRQFIRLSGLSKNISNASCDILYTKMTKKYDKTSNQIYHSTIQFRNFANELLPKVSKSVFPKQPLLDAQQSLFQDFIFINLVTNFPYLIKKTKVVVIESDPVSFIQSIVIQEAQKQDIQEVQKQDIQEVQKQDIQEVQKQDIQEVQKQDIQEILEQIIKEILEKIIIQEEEPQIEIISPDENKINQIQELVEIKPPKMCRYFDRILTGLVNCVQKISGKFIVCIKRVLDNLLICCIPDEKQQSQEEEQQEKICEMASPCRVQSPQWEEICDIITQSLEQLLQQAQRKDLSVFNEWSLNIANIIGILSHAIQIYTFCALAFSSEVNWEGNPELVEQTSEAVVAETDHWEQTFWVAFGVVCIFGFLLYPIFKLIRKGRLGINKDQTKAEFPQPQFFMEKFLTLLGNSLYLTIIATLLTPFSCQVQNEDWIVRRNQDMDCFGEQHSLYLILGIIAVVVYYPAATLLYPNIQFQNKNLDLKFDTSFLLLESQAKVIIAGFSVFFSRDSYIGLQLCVTILICLLLSLISFKTKPCLLDFYNLWKGGGYLIPVWVCFWALVNVLTQETLVSIVFLISGTVIIIGVLILVQYKVYGCDGIKKLKSIKKIFQGKQVLMNQKSVYYKEKKEEVDRCDEEIQESFQMKQINMDNLDQNPDLIPDQTERKLLEEEIQFKGLLAINSMQRHIFI